jgi:hypothetical protein
MVCDPDGASFVPSGKRFRVVTQADLAIVEQSQNVFVLTAASCLSDVAHLVTTTNRKHKLRALFVRTDVDPRLLPQVFEHAGLRTMRNTIAHYGHELPSLILRAWEMGAQQELIADISVVGDTLHVISCEPQSYVVPFDAITPLQRASVEDRRKFTLAGDGSHVHWPTIDVHMDLAGLLASIDVRLRAETSKHAYGSSYAKAIGHFRKARALRQTDIVGLSEREVRRIESEGEVTLESLRKLAAAHELDLADYLDRIATLAQGFGEELAEEPEGDRASETGT